MSVFLSRDLDSRITAREVAAVEEWLQSGAPLHSMRDHPAHKSSLMGGAWGARLDQGRIMADLWLRSWQEMLKDPLIRAKRSSKGAIQSKKKRYPETIFQLKR